MTIGGRCLLLLTGGTIGSKSSIGNLKAPSALSEEEVEGLRASVPFDLDVRPLMSVSSRAISLDEIRLIAANVISAASEGYQGVVVAHGTDTLEETAYALAVMCPPRIPVVLTGAMSAPDATGSDYLANLSGAVVAALDTRLASAGAVVHFGGELHHANWVTKAHTARTSPFVSSGLGPIGWVSEGRVSLAFLPAWTGGYLGIPANLEHEVVIVEATAGQSPRLLEGAAVWADGLVLSGTGGGHVPPTWVPVVDAAIGQGIPVVLASRTGSGPVLRSTYGGLGSESDLLERGVVAAGSLQPRKARMRLIVSLSLGLDVSEAFREMSLDG